MNVKSLQNLAEQLDSEIEETYSPPDPGFWKTSQIESDDEEIMDFDAAPKEKPFSRCPYIDFEAEEDPPAKKKRLPSKRLKIDDAAQLHPSWESQEVLRRRCNNL